MGTFEVNPQERAVWALRTAIRKAAQDAYGAEIVHEPIEGFSSTKREMLNDPLAGVRAARLARDVAIGELRTYAEQARGAGRTWDDIAEALNIDQGPDGEPRGEQAYRLVVEGRLRPDEDVGSWRRPVAHWRCGACGQLINDAGPFESHPDDVEQGHAANCSRQVAAIIGLKRQSRHDRVNCGG